MYLLKASEKHYDWGSHAAIQDFTGGGVPNSPLAEIWYGAHPSGPALLEDGRTLENLVAHEGAAALGDDSFERFAGKLPFLVKLIAPGRAVSLQVHPHAQRAREAFAEQQKDPAREQTFVDANHKPEQILALTAFDGLVGLRPVAEADAVLSALDLPVTRTAREALAPGDERAVHAAITHLASASVDDVKALIALAHRDKPQDASSAITTLLELAQHYPEDPGLAVSLMLQRVSLKAGDSVMVASGVPHAYMSGLALEVMANSDNVFRLGLTTKRVDIEESVHNLITTPALVNRPHRPASGTDPEEFRLEIRDLLPYNLDLSGSGPQIAVALTPGCTLGDGSRTLVLEPGGAVFVPHNSPFVASGTGRLAVISVPLSNEREYA